jgi:hypothetical protein
LRQVRRRKLSPKEISRTLTWPRVVQLARQGEPEVLYHFLKNCDVLPAAKCKDLAALLADAIGGRLERPSHRAKRSPETRDHAHSQRHAGERLVMEAINAEEKKLGKQLRGAERTKLIDKLSKWWGTTPNAVEAYNRMAKARR